MTRKPGDSPGFLIPSPNLGIDGGVKALAVGIRVSV